jgi:hypothetical protein
MQFKAAARTKLVAPLLSCASNARTTASGFDMMDECVSVSRTCVLHGDAFLGEKLHESLPLRLNEMDFSHKKDVQLQQVHKGI